MDLLDLYRSYDLLKGMNEHAGDAQDVTVGLCRCAFSTAPSDRSSVTRSRWKFCTTTASFTAI